MQITFKGEKVTLKGTQLKMGDQFPSFTLVKNDLSVATEKDFSGVRVFLTIPSLDTGVCDLEIRNFNQKALEFPDVFFAPSAWIFPLRRHVGAVQKAFMPLPHYQITGTGPLVWLPVR